MKRLFLYLLAAAVLSSVMPGNISMVLAGEETRTVVQPEASNEDSGPGELYAQSAVLMDGDSGRILYEKNGYQKKAMASTTKIMTCIVALENADKEEVVTASAYAASQPKVHLGMYEGEKFYLKDLLHSLMLESHNDSAAAIAEHVGGSKEGFAKMMNEKASELGCSDTYFITPNGLDASDENGTHSTTAADLARIMKYCITESPKKEEFLDITRQKSYSFSDVEKKGMFSCNNHNAFLGMMEGALSGKTGFTGDAGYCYVGALNRDGKTFIVALLACGWPNNKSYKWADTKALMNYGLDYYSYRDVFDKEKVFHKMKVTDGIADSGQLYAEAYTEVGLTVPEEEKSLELLVKLSDQVNVTYQLEDTLEAPVKKDQVIGKAVYELNGEVVREYPIAAKSGVEKISLQWIAEKVMEMYCKGIDVRKVISG